MRPFVIVAGPPMSQGRDRATKRRYRTVIRHQQAREAELI